MKIKKIYLCTISLLLLTSCDNFSYSSSIILESSFSNFSEKTTEKIDNFNIQYQTLLKSFTANGIGIEYTNEKKSNEFTFETKIGESSYQYTENGDYDNSIVLQKDGDGILSYYIDRDNNVKSKTLKDEETSTPISWESASNPFKYIDASLFTKVSNNTYKITNITSNKAINAGKQLANKLAYTSAYKFKDITLISDGEKITSLNIITDLMGYSDVYKSYEFNITLDTSSKSHEASLPKPYKHEKYHDNLLIAFNYLDNTNYIVNRTNSSSSSNMSKAKVAYGKDIFYISANNDESGIAIINGVGHEILNVNGTYYYSKTEEIDDNGDKITSLSYLLPYRSEAVELFKFNEKTMTYILEGIYASRFAFYFDPVSDLDDGFDITSVNKVEIKLDENSHFSTVLFTSLTGTINFIYTYSLDDLPFKISELKEYDTASIFYGTYHGKLNNEEINLTVGEYNKNLYEYAINYNGYTAIGTSINSSGVYFRVGADDYVLQIDEKGIYTLTKTDELGNKVSTTLVKIK